MIGNSRLDLFFGFLSGMLAGSAVTILLTPKPGPGIRERVQQKAEEYINDLRSRVGQDRPNQADQPARRRAQPPD